MLTAQLMLVLDATVVNVALPRIGTDLGFGPASLSWVLNAYALAFGGLLVLGGRLGDAYGRLRMFQAGLAVFTVASIAGGLAQSPEMLLGARALQGVGAALAAPSTLALLTTSAEDEPGRLRALALFGAVSSGGLSLGLLLGGVVTDLGSWRWTMFINVPIGLVVLALVGRFVTETARQAGPLRLPRGDHRDRWRGRDRLVPDRRTRARLGLAAHPRRPGRRRAAAGRAGAHRATRRPPPDRPRPACATAPASARSLAMALVVGGSLSMFYLVVQFTQRVLGFGPLAAGLAFLPLSLSVFAMSRFSPRLVGRFGATRMLMLGSLGLVGAYLWLSRADEATTYASGVFGPMLLIGLSMALCFMPITSLALVGRGAGPGGLRLRAAADHPAAGQRDRDRGDRLGVRRARGARASSSRAWPRR